MIIVVVVNEISERTNKRELIVSHGIDEYTGKAVILPNVHPNDIGAIYNDYYGEYVLNSP